MYPEPECPPPSPNRASPRRLPHALTLLEVGMAGDSPEGVRTAAPGAWHHHPTPPPLAGLILLVFPPTLQGSLPVRRPSQAQAGLWFISAAPAASLSRLVNRGSQWGRRRGLFWAMSGFRAFLVPVPIFSPRKISSRPPDLLVC